jgi:hypothetical protein
VKSLRLLADLMAARVTTRIGDNQKVEFAGSFVGHIETWRLEARKEVVLSVSGTEIKLLEAIGG